MTLKQAGIATLIPHGKCQAKINEKRQRRSLPTSCGKHSTGRDNDD